MKKEQIVDFTRRISQANRSGLVVVMYDIFFTYLDDARHDRAIISHGSRSVNRQKTTKNTP